MSGVMSQVSCVRCQVSGVACHVNIYSFFFVFFVFFDKVLGLVGGGSVINKAYPSSFSTFHIHKIPTVL